MQLNKRNILKCLFYIVGIGLILSITIYFIYPKLIYQIYGKNVPVKWSSDLIYLNLSQIHQKLGLPQEDVAAKDYQNWLERYWWGVKVLTIISKDCLKTSGKPSAIIYIVYVNGWYDPVCQKVIARSP